jgi:hypothetical protein
VCRHLLAAVEGPVGSDLIRRAEPEFGIFRDGKKSMGFQRNVQFDPDYNLNK